MNKTQRKAARAAIADANIDTSTTKGQRQAFGIAHDHEVAATHRTTMNGKQHADASKTEPKISKRGRLKRRGAKGTK